MILRNIHKEKTSHWALSDFLIVKNSLVVKKPNLYNSMF